MTPETPKHRGAARRTGLSIRYSLPLLISALAAVVLVVYAAAAYHQMRAAAIDAAREKLDSVTAQLSAMLGGSVTQMMAQARARAGDPAVIAFLRDPPPGDTSSALAALAAPANVYGVELRDPALRRVLATRAGLPGGEQADPWLTAVLARAEHGAAGRLRAVGDSLVAPVAGAVQDRGRTVGYLVAWRRVVGSGQTQIEQLVGLDARMYLANADGGLWTNLDRTVEGIPLTPAELAGPIEYERPGAGRWLAAAQAVPGAPWIVAMEFPHERVTARARGTLRTLALLGVLALLFAAGVTWVLAGRFTAPIMELAATAEALSTGEYGRRSAVSRRDEVGTLGRAFNHMADNVAFAHGALEQKVEQLAVLEARNREVSERLRHMLGSSPDVIYELKPAAGGAVFTWVSENVERLLGFSGAEVTVPGWWAGRLHPDDAAQPLLHAGPDGDIMREYRLRHRDGRYRWIRDHQRHAGPREPVVGAWSDVTELRSLEEQFRQAQKLEGIGRLAGGIAHDFNNIVTVILGESDMAISLLPANAPVRDSLDQVRTAAVRASLLTRQLLTFSRKQLTETTVFSFNDVVRDIRDMLRRLIGEDVELQFRLADDLAPVTADRGQIEQVLVNLVINARDAMPDGGSIIVETRNELLDEEYVRSHPAAGSGPFAALVVSDTGTGMSDEVRAHLFEPFFTTKGAGKGTGLGLATSYGIARQYGGHIGVYSELDVGTTMKLYLPRADHARQPAAPVRTSQEVLSRGNETILLVEDEAQVRAVVARMLGAQGYTVIQASNGDEALHHLRQAGRIDLLLTDLVMPRMGGRELAEHVRQLRPRLKVLFTSGYTEDVIVQNRLLEHDIVLLHKPFTRAALAAKVRETLDAA